ncbi:putative FBD domain, leucine-rich repeat domain, L domain-containing protein [Rosa chinensis]|uniref:Putative FBD domain, leucine-rich repeat domain, L domain-containing protein n=1 Tax=Rosa chinensis TaxID=74649 RepID=A0A2P6PL01_ROSCH|nr:F-box/FBD/LRR-repeat protein At1g13570 [Rosa chinensis]XP_024165888.1 F-box/FBD/LRR-repeat protein At1g13570 [Rosa chinensis]XP_024165892.1 F-box/FBD/LRR-repeat protein At1g13570 [Rosa chinensis]XP_024165896.1 F-box/FBD/LRR-repeat protein At1g13570 [Rosa chinensis]PRQ22599.1 putative FBD domain, leucine-rich repeat domain, L domain-containing protein [Rosa chinensis]
MLPDLEFDEFDWRERTNREFVNMIDHVLLVHIVPIRKFILRCTMNQVAPRDIDRWITHLSRNSIKELIINLWIVQEYNIPFSLFSCQGLVRLELLECLLKPPSTFKGFKSLKSLQLHHVGMAQDAFENLIRCSPLLERLTLLSCDGVTGLRIDAPNLQYLEVLGEFDVVNLDSASSITEAEIWMGIGNDPIGVPAGWIPACSSSNLLMIFDHLPHIRRLEIRRHFLDYLSLGALPEKLTKPCQHLKALSIDICFDDPDAIPTALCLLRSSPALQELEIFVDQRKKLPRIHSIVEELNSPCVNDNYNCTFSQLRLVKITEISGVKAELDFIRFLLLSSPLLERMTVMPGRFPEPSYADGFPKLVKELLQFKRESKHAEIILLDP